MSNTPITLNHSNSSVYYNFILLQHNNQHNNYNNNITTTVNQIHCLTRQNQHFPTLWKQYTIHYYYYFATKNCDSNKPSKHVHQHSSITTTISTTVHSSSSSSLANTTILLDFLNFYDYEITTTQYYTTKLETLTYPLSCTAVIRFQHHLTTPRTTNAYRPHSTTFHYQQYTITIHNTYTV